MSKRSLIAGVLVTVFFTVTGASDPAAVNFTWLLQQFGTETTNDPNGIESTAAPTPSTAPTPSGVINGFSGPTGAGTTALNAICLDLPVMDSPTGPKWSAAPPGWEVHRHTPDLISGNGLHPINFLPPGGLGQCVHQTDKDNSCGNFTIYSPACTCGGANKCGEPACQGSNLCLQPKGECFVSQSYQTGVSSPSPSGGLVGMFLGDQRPYNELWKTTLSALTPGTYYKVAVLWQRIKHVQEYIHGKRGSVKRSRLWGYFDGDLLMEIKDMPAARKVFTKPASEKWDTDDWSPAELTFQASKSQHVLIVGINQPPEPAGGWHTNTAPVYTPPSGSISNCIVVDSGDVCSFLEGSPPSPASTLAPTLVPTGAPTSVPSKEEDETRAPTPIPTPRPTAGPTFGATATPSVAPNPQSSTAVGAN